jgi:hypothetical protein
MFGYCSTPLQLTNRGYQMVKFANYTHLAGYTHAQALRLALQHGVAVSVPVSAAALRKARARAAQRTDGLRELAAQQLPGVRRGTFQSDTEFHNELLAMRCEVHTGTPQQVAVPMHNFATRVIA